MNNSMPVLRINMLALSACFVLGGLGGVVDALASSFMRTVKDDAVTVYAKADRSSRKVGVLTRNDTIHLQMELFNGSDWWCAINGNDGAFAGYVLCDQITVKTHSVKVRKRAAAHLAKQRTEPAQSSVQQEYQLFTSARGGG